MSFLNYGLLDVYGAALPAGGLSGDPAGLPLCGPGAPRGAGAGLARAAAAGAARGADDLAFLDLEAPSGEQVFLDTSDRRIRERYDWADVARRTADTYALAVGASLEEEGAFARTADGADGEGRDLVELEEHTHRGSPVTMAGGRSVGVRSS